MPHPKYRRNMLVISLARGRNNHRLLITIKLCTSDNKKRYIFFYFYICFTYTFDTKLIEHQFRQIHCICTPLPSGSMGLPRTQAHPAKFCLAILVPAYHVIAASIFLYGHMTFGTFLGECKLTEDLKKI